MKTNRILLVGTLVAVSLTSCVSKKKYLDMESSKIRAEQRVRELTDENEARAARISKMIADFETMKKDLMASNATKDQLIGDLNGQINKLKSNVQEKDASIEEKLYAFEFEKRRMDDVLKASKVTETTLKEENRNMANELSQLRNELTDSQFNLNREKESKEQANQQLAQNASQYEQQASQIAALKADIQKLKVDAKEKDETIERLNNNVSLLKSQLAK
ncbi:MAG: hypothetical protein ACK5JD_05350 [Mangrovibacterium sp.]